MPAMHLAHVVGATGRGRHDIEQRVVAAGRRIIGLSDGQRLSRIARKIREEAPCRCEGLVLAVDAEIGEPLLIDLHRGAAKRFLIGVFADACLHQRRAGQPHDRLARVP